MSRNLSQLVPVKQGTAFCVDARQLHKALRSGRQFTNWIQNRIEKYGFIEGADFLTNLLKTPEQNGRPTVEYAITTGMAKELCMIENNEIGREVRRYFIRCEEQLKNQVRQPTLLEACRAYVEAADRAEALGQQVIEATRQRDEIGNNFGAGPEYYKVSEIPWLHELFYHNNQRQLHPALGNKLAQISHDLGYEVKNASMRKAVIGGGLTM